MLLRHVFGQGDGHGSSCGFGSTVMGKSAVVEAGNAKSLGHAGMTGGFRAS